MKIGLDGRIRSYLESGLGFSLDSFARAGIAVRESPARSDERENRLSVTGIAGHALVTGIPRVIAAVSPAIRSLTTEELFSPLGMAELRRAMAPEDAESLAHGLGYMLTDPCEFRPAETRHEPRSLRRAEMPEDQLEVRMSERRPPDEAEQEDFTWAFACYHHDADAVPTELAPFGPQCASIAIVIWKSAEVAGYGLWTEEAYRGRGYALAAVSAATKFVLDQGAVAVYDAYTTNIPSLRVARRLGFRQVWQTIWA